MRVIITEERPRLRGIPDVVALFVLAPLALWLCFATPAEHRWVAAVYGVCLLGLFGVSASYHAITWGPRGLFWWKRVDHSMIYVFIAASYMPTAVCILDEEQGLWVTIFVWAGALLGALKTVFWMRAPRALSVAIYLALGWSIAPFWSTVSARMSTWTLAFFVGGGVLYSLGAIVYATRRPNPWPRTFGYHEVMHLFIIAAALTQYLAQHGILVS